MESTTTYSNSPAGGATSVQGLFLIHHLMALQTLQNILVQPFEDDEMRMNAFNRQSLYLQSLIVDDRARANVQKAIDKREVELLANPLYKNDRNNILAARLLVVTELCRYLSQSMDLIHHDIVSSIGGGNADVTAELDAGDEE